MDAFFESAPALLAVAEKSPFGIIGLVIIVLSPVALYLFYPHTGIIKLVGFFLLITSVLATIYLMLLSPQFDNLGQSQNNTFQEPTSVDKSTNSIPIPTTRGGERCVDNNPSLECLWIR